MPVFKPWTHVWLTLLALVVVLAIFEFLPLDMWLQTRLYNSVTGAWLWSRDEPVLRFLLYDGIRVLYGLFALGLLALVVFSKGGLARRNRSGLLVVLLSLLLVPLAANGLKAVTNVACPRALEDFGGSVPYVKLLEHYPAGRRPDHRMRCYPAGHASGGFALLSLCYLAGPGRRRRLALLSGMAAGWGVGFYKMAIGDHFLSHTVVSMLMAWLIINLVAAGVLRGVPVPVLRRWFSGTRWITLLCRHSR